MFYCNASHHAQKPRDHGSKASCCMGSYLCGWIVIRVGLDGCVDEQLGGWMAGVGWMAKMGWNWINRSVEATLVDCVVTC